MTVSMISITTQNIIKEMKENEERENELNAYSEFTSKLINDYSDIIKHITKKYDKANEHYMRVHISESENKKLSKELQHEIKVYERMRSKYYFQMEKYQQKINMIGNMHRVYVNSKFKKAE
jgi:hypothetical protein